MNLNFDHWFFQVLGISIVLVLMYFLFKYIGKKIPKVNLELIEETSDMNIETKYWINLIGSTFDENATYLKFGLNSEDEVVFLTRSNFPKTYNSFILVDNKKDLKNIFYYNVVNYQIGNEILKLKIRGKLMNTVSLIIKINPNDLELLTKIEKKFKE